MISTVEARVFQFLLEHCQKANLKKGILVANSGGPDSTALLIALHNVKKRMDFRLFSAYIDHGLREIEETRKEAAFIESLCKERDIPFFKEFIPPGKIEEEGRKHRKGIEAQARTFRYRLLQQICDRANAYGIALGHTLDDQVETLVMRFFQGSGLKGLAGIPEVSGNSIRPLLGIEKECILEYLEKRGIPFKEDPSNFSLTYRRNKVRHELLPLVESIFPGVRTSLGVFQKRMKNLGKTVDEHINSMLSWEASHTESEEKTVHGSGTEYAISLARFNKAHRFYREESLYRTCDALLNTPDLRLPYRFVQEMIDLLEKAEKGDRFRNGCSLERPLCQGHGVALYVRDKNRKACLTREIPLSPSMERFRSAECTIVDKEFQQLKKYRKREEAEVFEDRKKMGYVIVGERGKSYIIGSLGKKIIIRGITGAAGSKWEDTKDPRTMMWISGERIAPPLIIRNRLSGDHLLLGNSRRSVVKILKNWKVPISLRDKIPILEDRKGVIGICGAPFGYTNKITKRVELEKTDGKGEDTWSFEFVSPKAGSCYGNE